MSNPFSKENYVSSAGEGMDADAVKALLDNARKQIAEGGVEALLTDLGLGGRAEAVPETTPASAFTADESAMSAALEAAAAAGPGGVVQLQAGTAAAAAVASSQPAAPESAQDRAAAALAAQPAGAGAAAPAAPPTASSGATGAAGDADALQALQAMMAAAAADPSTVIVHTESSNSASFVAAQVQKAGTLFGEGQFEATLAALDEALADASSKAALLDDATLSVVHSNRGAALEKMDRGAEAIAAFSAAIAADARAAARGGGDGGGAADAAADAARRQLLRHNFAVALKRTGEFEKAAYEFGAAAALARAAAAAGGDAAAVAANLLSSLCGQAACLIQLERFSEALAVADAAVVARGASSGGGGGGAAQPLKDRAYCLLQLGRHEDAVAALDTAAAAGVSAEDLAPWRLGALTSLAQASATAGSHAEAAAFCAKALALGAPAADTEALRFARAVALSHLPDQLGEAVAEFRRVLGNAGSGGQKMAASRTNDARVALGNVLLLQGKPLEAAELLEAASASFGTAAAPTGVVPAPATAAEGGAVTVATALVVWLHLGMALAQCGAAHFEKARMAFGKVLDIEPANSDARKGLEGVTIAHAEAGAAAADSSGGAAAAPSVSAGTEHMDTAIGQGEAMLAAAQQQRATAATAEVEARDAADQSALAAAVFPYERLTQEPLPAGVDASKKEVYLSDADFAAHLGTAREDFCKMPGWKQKKAKQAARLF
jgi:tetratricopeptide (TPR) repeat protein